MRLFHNSKFSLLLFVFLATFIAGSGTPNAESNAVASDYVRCAPGNGGDLRTSNPSTLTVTVNTDDRKQTIHNFGASDAWSIQFVGQWPSAKRNAIADLLFDTGLDVHNDPKGIGLSSWRFNVGAGSSRQHNISDNWRSTDTFLSEDFSSYEWWRQPGQRWFLQAAKARGCEHFIAFCNSPPINMTKNGNAFCDSSVGSTNLAADKADDFAVYLATILKHFRDVEGISFQYVSPFNEPNWDWNGNGQEGCRYYNSDIKWAVNALHSELQNQGLATEIEVPEAGDMGYLYGNSGSRGDYIDSFFNTGSSNYIGNKVAHKAAGHSYFSCWPEDDRLVGMRQTLRNKLNQYPGLEYWATEYCILIPEGSWVPQQYWGYGNGRDLGIDPALWVTRVIHHGLTVAEASAWQWWLAVSPYNYKDGLVYIDKGQTDGNYYESKMLWGMGNFSRFIRPGMQRVAVYRSDNATPDDTVYGLMVSAYYKSDDDIVVVVFVNWAYEDKPVELDFIGAEIGHLIPYVTRGNNLNEDNLTAYNLLGPDITIAIPARSIVTIVGGVPGIDECNKDGRVDFKDLAILASQWSQTNCGMCGGADLTGNKRVDAKDLAVLAEGWLTASTIPPLPEQATNPNPHDGATDVNTTAVLSWTAGSDTVSYDVYIGMVSPPPFVGNQTATTFEPGFLGTGAKYYWRIDAVNGWGKTTGQLWNFTTTTTPPPPPPPPPPGQASNPNPADGATGVITGADLSWTAGLGASSRNVYFGESSPPPFIHNQTATTFDPGTMDYNTTYYWRIDEITIFGTIPGPLWSFTTTELTP